MSLFKILLRRKLIIIGLMVGIILSFSMLVSALVGADYFATLNVTKSIKNSYVDEYYTVRLFKTTDLKDLKRDVLNIDYVKQVAIGRSYQYFFGGNISNKWTRSWYVVDIFELNNLTGLEIINGSIGEKGALITEYMAKYLGVSVGDNITLQWTTEIWNGTTLVKESYQFNYTVNGIFTAEGFALEVLAYLTETYYYFENLMIPGYETSLTPNLYEIIRSCIILSPKLFNDLISAISYNYPEKEDFVKSKLFIEFDKDRVIIPWDLEKSEEKIARISSEVYYTVSKYGSIEQNYNIITAKLRLVKFYSNAVKSAITYIMFPLLILTVILTIMVNWVTADITARDIALLRIRGATKSSIGNIFGVVGSVSGLIGGLFGALLAPILFTMITNFRFPIEAKFLEPFTFSLRILPNYLIFSTIAGALFGFLTSFWVGNRAAKINITNYASGELPSHAEEFKFGRLDTIFLIIGIYSVIELSSGLIVLRSLVLSGVFYSFLFALFITIFFIVETIAITVGPFFFLYSFSKLLAGKVEKLALVLGYLIKPLMRDLFYIPVKSLTRNPARLSRVFFILSLALSISITVPVLSATQLTRERINSSIMFGADVKINLGDTSFNDTLNAYSEILKVNGVTTATPYITTYSIDTGYDYSIFVAFNSNYLLYNQWKDGYLIGGTKEKIYQEFVKTNTVIINYGFAKRYNLDVGDHLTITFTVYQENIIRTFTYQLKIVGITKFLVGLESYSIFLAQEEYSTYLLVNLETFLDFVKKGAINDFYIDKFTILVDIQSGVNVTSIKEKITQILEGTDMYSYTVLSYDDYIKMRRERNPLFIVIYFSEAEMYIIGLISVIAMILLMFVSVWERKKELILLYVRGLSGKEIMTSLISEALLISTIGTLLGVIVAFSYGSLQSTMFIMSPSYQYPPGYLITIPWYLPLYILLLLTVFSISAIPSYLYLIKRGEVLEEVRISH